MSDFVNLIRSAVPGAVWPAIPGEEAAAQLALQYQLDSSQWQEPDRLLASQLRQLDALLQHAYATVPYYGERWRGVYDPGGRLSPERFSRLPVLTRSEVQAHPDALRSTGVPPSHGVVTETRTSGSTGRPVRVLKTALTEALWRAFVLREHRWHRRELRAKLAAIRHNAEEGDARGWGPATDVVAETGPSATLSMTHDVDAQLDWLDRQQPAYLLTYPSNLAALARRARERDKRLPGLIEIRTMGEVLDPEVREACRRAWGVPVTDAYSSQETGYLALQCPDVEHYHVQSEGVFLEVLSDAGVACGPGETGRVVVTDLHNYAMPLVRYEIGDFAEAGERCACGRGLPVLRRIAGRARNMLVLAGGARYWPAFGSGGLSGLAPILQQQVVQKRLDLIEVRLVTARPLTPAEEERIRQRIQGRLPAPFRIEFRYLDSIDRGAGGKYEDFVSEVG